MLIIKVIAFLLLFIFSCAGLLFYLFLAVLGASLQASSSCGGEALLSSCSRGLLTVVMASLVVEHWLLGCTVFVVGM